MITEPKLEQRDAQPYVGIRSSVTMPEMGDVLPPLFGEVFGWLASQGVEPAGAPFWRYVVIDMADKLVIDVGVPVAKAVAGAGRVIADVLPAGQYLVTVYTGHYDGLMDATRQLIEWAEAHEIAWDVQGNTWGSRIETYVTDPTSEPDSAKWQTELAFRVADR